MTLILSAVVHDTAFQVSDQLAVRPVRISEGKARLFYPFMNKAVVFRASDALVCIGISGRAYLDGVASDQWVAQQLTGIEDLEDAAFVLGAGGPPAVNLFGAMQRIRNGVEAVFQSMPIGDRVAQSFSIVGWQRRRRNQVKRILWRIDNHPIDRSVFEWVDFLRETPESGRILSLTPAGVIDEELMERLHRDLGLTRSRHALEQQLVAGVRAVAGRYPQLVGPHCVAVQLFPHRDPQVMIRFYPAVEVLVRLRRGGPAVYPVAFTPWVISGGQIMGPNIVVGRGSRWQVGGLWLEVVSPSPLPPDDATILMDRVPRPTDPQRRRRNAT